MQNPLNRFKQILRIKLAGGKVHSDCEGKNPLIVPLFQLPACCPQHPFTNWYNKSSIFSNWDKSSRRYGSVVWVIPPNKRFYSLNFSSYTIYLRLIDKLKFILL